MRRTARLSLFGILAAVLLALGLAGPAAADVNIRSGKAADLPVTAAKPTTAQLEKQYAGFWNPNVPLARSTPSATAATPPRCSAS